MTVRYIFGRAGKGKSHRVFQEMAHCLADGRDNQLVLLVPEQFTLQSERQLIEKLDLPGIMRIEVLSFTRLAERVFAEVGGKTRVLINEQGKQMVLRKIIDENAGDLGIYKKTARQNGFISKCSELLSELKRQDIKAEDLKELLEKIEDEEITRKKLNDIILIYEEFNKYLQDTYIDTEDRINLLIEKIDNSSFLKGAQVWIDGFTTFPLQNLRIIEKIMLMAEDTSITLTMEPGGEQRDHELFNLSHFTYNSIHNIAQKLGMAEERIIIKEEPELSKEELIFLERELYAYPYHSFQKDINQISVFRAASINSEIENAAAQMLELVREKGYRWKDITVICADIDSYCSLIKRIFQEYHIPYFIDEKRNIMSNPIIQTILSSLDIVKNSYRLDDVLRFIKSGFSGLNVEQCELMENYALRYGIQGSKWKKRFELGEEDITNVLNEWRESFIKPLDILGKKVKSKKSVTEITMLLYAYMEKINLREKLENEIEHMRQKECYELVNENTQIWNTVVEILEQMVEILGEQELTLKEYSQVLEAGFSSIQLGLIPTMLDQVLVGDIQRSKSHDIKALFLLGVNDGVLPSGRVGEGILSDEEKLLLEKEGLYLGMENKINDYEENFSIYSMFSKPRDYLYISYALADGEGKAMRPSLLIDRLSKLYPGLEIKSDLLDNHIQQLKMVTAPDSTFKHLIEKLRLHIDGESIEDFWWDVYAWYYNNEEWKDKRNLMIEGLFHQNQINHIGRENARQLYKLPLHSSVSRLEQFVRCPFAHFVRYGLNAQERAMFTVEAPDIGELFHQGFLSFSHKLFDKNLDWQTIKKNECDELIDSVMDDILPLHRDGILSSSNRYKYLSTRLKRISRRAVWTLTEHIQKGDFEPIGHEISFGRKGVFPPIEVELESGEKVYLEGRIDRVDLFDNEESTYVKIIDYKSGDKSFSLSDVYYGLSLQLLIYLTAVLQGHEKLQCADLKPAGIFYFKIDDPLVKSDEKIKEKIEKEIARTFKMKGVLINDAEILRHMDCDLQGESEIIPVRLNNDGTLGKRSSILSAEDFQALISHVNGLVRQIAEEIMNGKISIEPINNNKQTACTWCPYHSICQFDQLFEDNDYKNIRQLNDEEVISKIRQMC